MSLLRRKSTNAELTKPLRNRRSPPRRAFPQGRTSKIGRAFNLAARDPLIDLAAHRQAKAEEKGIEDRVHHANGSGDDGSVREFERPAEDDVAGEDEDDRSGCDRGETENL